MGQMTMTVSGVNLDSHDEAGVAKATVNVTSVTLQLQRVTLHPDYPTGIFRCTQYSSQNQLLSDPGISRLQSISIHPPC